MVAGFQGDLEGRLPWLLGAEAHRRFILSNLTFVPALMDPVSFKCVAAVTEV